MFFFVKGWDERDVWIAFYNIFCYTTFQETGFSRNGLFYHWFCNRVYFTKKKKDEYKKITFFQVLSLEFEVLTTQKTTHSIVNFFYICQIIAAINQLHNQNEEILDLFPPITWNKKKITPTKTT